MPWWPSSQRKRRGRVVADYVKLDGVAASEGVAVGRAFVHVPSEPKPERETIPREAVEEELKRFRTAVEAVVRDLSETAQRLREGGSESEAGIFDAHAEMAEDPELLDGVEERVRDLQSPEAAVLAVGEEYARMLAQMGDEYLSARADDVRDVATQIATELMGGKKTALETLAEPSVILAVNLAPSDTARIPQGMALGFVISEGSRTSHVSIMARSFGIPAVVGVGGALEDALGAEVVAVDGTEGFAVANPDSATISHFEEKQRNVAAEAALLEEYKHIEARTRDGRRIEVAANIGSAEETEGALAWGAEGVGLFRTEFLFMKRTDLPSEEEQYGAYRKAAEAFGEKPVIIRTIDVGGDKDLPGVDQPEEENPFLGWRGIRMCLDVPELFKPQLRAILRAAPYGKLRIMFPMVVDTIELRAAKKILEECREELKNEGAQIGEVDIGVMVETPAAAIRAQDIAPEVSFFSIGTNDLVQYTLAADRGNERLTRLQSADHPAVLDLIKKTCEAAKGAGIWVGVCGEAAGEPAMIPKLVEFGVTELSMSAPSIPRAKKIVSEL
jgi:phosphoenolpyruvate-protein phosphotransferase